MSIPDIYDMWCAHQDEEEEFEERLPVCCCCDNPINDDFLYEIDGDLYCEECMKDEFRRLTEDFMEGD